MFCHYLFVFLFLNSKSDILSVGGYIISNNVNSDMQFLLLNHIFDGVFCILISKFLKIILVMLKISYSWLALDFYNWHFQDSSRGDLAC